MEGAHVAHGTGAGPLVGVGQVADDVGHVGEFFFDELFEAFLKGFIADAGDHVFKEAEHEKSVCLLGRDAAGAQVEELLRLDLAGGGAMGAFHVVVQNFQAGEGVGFGALGEQEVAVGLVGVCSARARGDADEAGEDGFGDVVEGVFVEEVGAAVGGVVLLKGALVNDLVAIGEGDGEHVAGTARAGKAGAILGAGELGAEVDGAGEDVGVALGHAGEEFHAEGFAVEFLHTDEFDGAAGADMHVAVVGEECRLLVGGVEVFDDGAAGVLSAQHEELGEGAGELAGNPVVDFDVAVELGVFFNAHEEAGTAHGGVEVDVTL